MLYTTEQVREIKEITASIMILFLVLLTLSSTACYHGDSEWCKENLNWTQLVGMLADNTSLNNTVYTLAGGHHVMEGGEYSFQFITNFTLRGSPDGSTVIHCNSTNQLCRVLFKQSGKINIHDLKFVYPIENRIKQIRRSSDVCYKSSNTNNPSKKKYYKHCEYLKSWVFADSANVTISNVHFVGPDGNWLLVGPVGTYHIHNVTFYTQTYSQGFFNTNESDNIITFVLLSQVRNVNFTCKVSKMSFFAENYSDHNNGIVKGKEKLHSTAIHIIKEKATIDTSMNNSRKYVQNSNIMFESVEVKNQAVIQLSINTCGELLLSINNITAQGGWYSEIRNFTKSDEKFIGSAIRMYINSENCTAWDSQKSSISINNGQFTNYLSSKGTGLLYEVYHSHAANVHLKVSRCSFRDSWGLKYANMIHAECQTPQKVNLTEIHRCPTILTLENVRISKNERGLKVGKCNLGERTKDGYFYQESYQNVKLSCPTKFPWKGALHLEGFQGPSVSIANINISHSGGKGISLINSNVQLIGNNIVDYNLSPYGGGILLKGNSLMLFHNNTMLSITKNYGFRIGGGMYIMDSCTFELNPLNECYCFFQFVHENGSIVNKLMLRDLNVTISFQNNKAGRVVNLFNTNFDKCKLETEIDGNRTQLYQQLFHAPLGEMNNSYFVSSLPRRIVNCNDSGGDQLAPVNVYMGQDVTMDLMVLADMDLPMESVAYFYLEKSWYVNYSELHKSLPLVYNTKLDAKCNIVAIQWCSITQQNLRNSNSDNMSNPFFFQINIPLFNLAPNEIPDSIFLYSLVNVSIYPYCPPGFIMSNNECQCHPYLTEHNITCELSTVVTLTIPRYHWIGRVYANSTEVHFSTSCYPGFCKTPNKSVDLSTNPDDQCLFGRTGVLCSICPTGKTAVYGSNICKPCSSKRIWLTIFAFLLLGPLMVLIMCCFNLTIATRTLNGFLLYTYVVNINSDRILPLLSENSMAFLSILSLDFGYGLCLFKESGQFTVAIYYFVLPLYMLLIVVSALLLPKCNCLNIQRLHKAVGPRIIPVLATITWLSFSHISMAVINSLHPTDLCNTQTQTCHKVWIYDGELEYFGSWKHIILGTIAVFLLICFLIPIAVIAIFGDLLRRCISRKVYLNFLDAFHASYRHRYGFWVGVRLVTPIIIVLLKTLFTGLESQQVDLGVVTIFVLILSFQIVTKPFRGVQVERCLPQSLKRRMTKNLSQKIANNLDVSFLLNIILLFSFLVYENRQNAQVIIILSRVIAIGEFLMIVLYHFLEYTSLGAKLVEKLPFLVLRIKHVLKVKSIRNLSNGDNGGSVSASRFNTVYLELNREEESISYETETENDVRSEDSEEEMFNRANQLREPLTASPSLPLQ